LSTLILAAFVLLWPSPGRALDQPSQNYFVEVFLKGAYHHQPDLDYLEHRASDGLLTKGVSRIVDDPRICLVGGDATTRQKMGDLLALAVDTLTGGIYQAIFLGTGCDAGINVLNNCPVNPGVATYCHFAPTDQITVFIGCQMRQAQLCHAAGAVGEVHGGAIAGGARKKGTHPTVILPS
jgi:hypothetical protein